jgi:hypothetical protein
MSDARGDLAKLADALRLLHHLLLVATQKRFEKLHGRVPGAGALLQLALNDPLFAWLRPLSRQAAAIDELVAAEDVAWHDLDGARTAVIALLDDDGEFRATYLVYLHAEPDVVLAHAALRRLLVRRAPARAVPGE